MKKNLLSARLIVGLALLSFLSFGCSKSSEEETVDPEPETTSQETDVSIELEEDPAPLDNVIPEPTEETEPEVPTKEKPDLTGPIYSLREYLFPEEEPPVFYVSTWNYEDPLPWIDYSVLDAENIISRLQMTGTKKESDMDQDGKIDQITYTADHSGWAMADKNKDGFFDYYLVMECNFNNTVDFKVEWTDCDHNGTIDEVKIHASTLEDLARNRFSAQYLYADYEVLDSDTGKVDYTNKNRIQLGMMLTLPPDNKLDEQQFFRDYDGDFFVDMVQIRRFYDINNDGVKESMKISSDRDLDGIFEDEYAYDGTIFDNSLIYDY